MKSVSKFFLGSLFALGSFTAVATAAAAEAEITGILVNDSYSDCQALIAGQHTTIGEVCLSIEDENLLVEYSTAGDWYLAETQLWVGSTLLDMPQTRNGNPKVGNFPYKDEVLDLQNWQYSIALEDIDAVCGFDFLMAAHAAVYRVNGLEIVQSETAWSAGDRMVEKGNWATYSTFQFDCSSDDDNHVVVDMAGETGFAYSGETAVVFSKFGFQRWGWTNGPLTEGYQGEWDIYAGAGQSDLDKGTVVGSVSVSYSSGSVQLEINMLPGYYFTEAQSYAGTGELPLTKQGKNYVQTVAPGQYPSVKSFKSGATSDAVSFTGLSGAVYVIVHVTVSSF